MERIITLPKTGAVTTVSVSAPAGLVLYNDHESASVTISTSAAVSPNAGIVIRPKGQVTWKADGEPIYGVANSPLDLPLLVTDDIGELASPLDVAVATATRLAAAGIPNVGMTEQIYEGDTRSNPVTIEHYVPIPLLGYSSIIVEISVRQSTNVTVMQQMTTVAPGAMLYRKNIPISGSGVVMSLPVVGQYLWFSEKVYVRVLGTNRTLEFSIMDRDTFRKFGSTAAYPTTFPRGVNTPLPALDAVGSEFFIHGGGMVTCRTYIKGATAGIFTCLTANGSIDLISSREMSPGDSTGTFGVGIVGLALPPGVHSICFKAEAAGTHVLDISVIPER